MSKPFNTAFADAFSAAVAPSGPFKVGQRVRRLIRRPVTGTVIKIITVETDDGDDYIYDIQGAIVRLDTPDIVLGKNNHKKELWEEVVDAEQLDDLFWEITANPRSTP